MDKRLLLIINPVAGTKKANKYLTDIVSLFSEAGYECTVQATTPTYNAKYIAQHCAADKDLILCIGGDGTLNETIAGCMAVHLTPTIGYVPGGSTNDFAKCLQLSLKPMVAVENVLNGQPVPIDVGTFNGNPFVYTASFGIFTKASYNTPREMKNSLGYLAYVLEGAKELTDIKSYHLTLESPEQTIEGDYIFCGICNSTCVGGGVIRFKDDMVDLNDGLLEVLLVKYPRNLGEFMQLILDLNAGNYQSEMIEMFSVPRVVITTEEEIDWTVDGECQKGMHVNHIEAKQSAIKLVL